MSSSGTLESLLVQAKITNMLLAARLRENMSQKELVKLLASTGATNKEIALVLNTSAATVNTTKYGLKKEAEG